MIVRLLYPIMPALVLVAVFFAGLPVFALRVRLFGWPGSPESKREYTRIATPFVMRYVFWLLTPLELGLAGLGVSPNAITLASVGLCAVCGVLAATGHLALSAWLYFAAGMLDALDGRVARRTGRSSSSGALLDSVTDRWGEFFLLGGLALFLRDTFGLFSVLACIAGSQMVSYTRARGEALGLNLAGGTMQRAERIVIVGLAMLAGAVGGISHAYDGRLVMAGALLGVGLLSSWTSLHRLAVGIAALRVRDSVRSAPVRPGLAWRAESRA